MKATLLHGALGRPEDWDGFRDLLGDVQTEAADLYGLEILPLDEMGEALCELDVDGDVVIGYSMGGRLAMHALLEPDAPWSKAVIISADPGAGTDDFRVAKDREWAALVREDWAVFCDEWAGQPVFGGAEMPWQRAEISDERREAIAEGFEQWSVGLQCDLRKELARLEIPVLWIVGGQDEKFCRLAESLPENIRVEVIEEAGHRVPWDQPEAAAEAIRSFLS